MSANHWTLTIDEEKFSKIKGEERFWQLVALARAVNALRFAHGALFAHQHDEDTSFSRRTRLNSFFFNCALLYEALLLVERLGKHYRDLPAFAGLRAILKDPTATAIRNSKLNPLRNRLAFHFSEDEIGAQLAKLNLQPNFISGDGPRNADVHYELADICTLGVFTGVTQDDPAWLDKVKDQFEATTDLGAEFMDAAEFFIHDVVTADGWRISR